MEFRKLKADEIDVRIGSAKESGVSLLLYKDARVDQNILDESIGRENWQRDHKEIKGNVYCGVAIFNEKLGQWIWKWDAGSESYSDAVKGEASDSFKRACFNWGIGRELYTSPFIWIKAEDLKTLKALEKKVACYDNFKVLDIDYDVNGSINKLSIKNTTTSKVVFNFGGNQVKHEKPATKTRQEEVIEAMRNKDMTNKDVIDFINITLGMVGKKVSELEDEDYIKLLQFIDSKKHKEVELGE